MNIIFKTSVTASNINGNIASFYIKESFKDDVLILYPSVIKRGKNWSSAGFVNQIIVVNDKEISLTSKRLVINEFNTFEVKKLDKLDYYLKFNPEDWLFDLKIDVYSVDSELANEIVGNSQDDIKSLQSSIQAVRQLLFKVNQSFNKTAFTVDKVKILLTQLKNLK